jgi:hypothetical protein
VKFNRQDANGSKPVNPLAWGLVGWVLLSFVASKQGGSVQRQEGAPSCELTQSNAGFVTIATALSLWAIFIVLLFPHLALAESGGDLKLSPLLLDQASQAVDAPELPLDSATAKELPHHALGRDEAIALTTEVFGSLFQGVAGPFAGLDVERYLSDNAAVVASSQPLSGSEYSGGASAQEGSTDSALLESSLPLRTVNEFGAKVPVDLGLVREGAVLEPVSPLVEVSVPTELATGIELPELGIALEMINVSTDRAPTVSGENLATYPNVASDTDLSVEPIPTGVETFTTLRSPSAPSKEEFRLSLPEGAELLQKEDGAVVQRNGKTVLAIPAPSAIDADGTLVPATLTTSGANFSIEVSAGQNTAYPILVDPMLESYDWYDNYATPDANSPWYFSTSSPLLTGRTDTAGLWVEAAPGSYPAYVSAGWSYFVPRLKEEEAAGRVPSSYLQRMDLMHIGFGTTAGPYSPYLTMGLMGAGHWAGKPGNETVWGYGGNGAPIYAWQGNPNVPGLTLHFENGTPGNRDQTAKTAIGLALGTAEAASLSSRRSAILGWGSVEVADEDVPKVVNGSVSPWMNQTATAQISSDAQDTGLGVKYVGYYLPGGQGWRTAANPCTGTAKNPCPRTWHTWIDPNQYSPASMPQGINQVLLSVEDILGNHAAYESLALLRIDHTKPTVTLSGSLLEQAKLGTTLPQYVLRYTAKDGDEAAPQSGVVSTRVKIDGKLVESEYSPGCATKNCSISRELKIPAANYTVGTHTVEVTATDGVGLANTSSSSFTIAKDTTNPSLTANGGFFAGPMGWLSQQAYPANLVAKDVGGYGVKSVTFSVDGKVVKSWSGGSCEAGGCEGSLSTSMNMATYKGGEHSAEAVAIDGAGNKATQTWTVFVDPSGAVPASEAADTVEALEQTEPETTALAPNDQIISAEEQAQGNAPEIEQTGPSEFQSTGTPVETTVVTGAKGSITLDGGEGAIKVLPVSPAASTSAEVVEDVSLVTSNTKTSADTVVRPKYNGLLDFQAIRASNAPETYSWEIALTSGETLKLGEGGQSASVYFENETAMMLISAMPARDALGKVVPTHLSVTAPNIITLTVEHTKTAYVYPVTAGPSFEVGHSTVEAVYPPPPKSEKPLVLFGRASAPVALPFNNTDSGGASASVAHPHHSITYDWELCAASNFELFGAQPGCWVASLGLEATYEYNNQYAWWKPSKPHPKCPLSSHAASLTLTYCEWAGANHQQYGGGYHITALAKDQNNGFFGATFTSPEHLALYLYGDGYGKGHDTEALCNPLKTC